MMLTSLSTLANAALGKLTFILSSSSVMTVHTHVVHSLVDFIHCLA